MKKAEQEGTSEVGAGGPSPSESSTLSRLFDEIGVALAAVEFRASHPTGEIAGYREAARDCLRAVAAIRDRACMTCGSTAPKTDIGACRNCVARKAREPMGQPQTDIIDRAIAALTDQIDEVPKDVTNDIAMTVRGFNAGLRAGVAELRKLRTEQPSPRKCHICGTTTAVHGEICSAAGVPSEWDMGRPPSDVSVGLDECIVCAQPAKFLEPRCREHQCGQTEMRTANAIPICDDEAGECALVGQDDCPAGIVMKSEIDRLRGENAELGEQLAMAKHMLSEPRMADASVRCEGCNATISTPRMCNDCEDGRRMPHAPVQEKKR